MPEPISLSILDDVGRAVRHGTRYRAARALSFGAWAGIVVHTTFLLSFASQSMWMLVAFNALVSLPAFVVVGRLAEERPEVAGSVAVVEVIFHQAIAVHHVGWSPGFQDWLFVAVTAVFLFPSRPGVPYREALVGITVVVAVALYVVHGRVPATAFPETATTVLAVGNRAAALLTSAVLVGAYAWAAERTEASLAQAHAASDWLLRSILPDAIAARLKRSTGVLADGVPGASVLFADIVGFTPLSQTMSPDALVAVLNDIFSAFDAEVQARGLLKIKTLGDAYMAAAGLPEPCDDHADRIADFALAMRRILSSVPAAARLRMRIGVHSGPVVAGVIGRTTLAYDIWGDTVNTASRMESHGQPGEIQVSDATRSLLGDRFVLRERGLVEIKGKGAMKTWFLDGRA